MQGAERLIVIEIANIQVAEVAEQLFFELYFAPGKAQPLQLANRFGRRNNVKADFQIGNFFAGKG